MTDTNPLCELCREPIDGELVDEGLQGVYHLECWQDSQALADSDREEIRRREAGRSAWMTGGRT